MTADSTAGIVVLGSPRSGTSLVARLLDSHPRISCPPETNLLNASCRFLREDPFAEGLTAGVVSGLGFSGMSREMIVEKLRAFVFEILSDIARANGKVRWAEKTAFDAFYLEQVQELCGDGCRYVFVVRHGLDVACSMKELFDYMETYLPEIHSYIRRYPRPLEAFVRAWTDINEAILKANSADASGNCLLIRYEDLVADPKDEVGRLMEFVGEEAAIEHLLSETFSKRRAVGLGDWKIYERKRFEQHSVGRWKRELSTSTASYLGSIANPTLKKFRYPEVTSNGELSGEEARHLYEIRRMVAGLSSSSSRGKEQNAD